MRRPGRLLILGSMLLLAACQTEPDTIIVTPPPAASVAHVAPTSLPAAPAVTEAPPAARPAVATSEPANPSVATPAGRVVATGSKTMYQMDARHTGRSPFAGPRRPVLLRSFDLNKLETREPGDLRPNVESSAAVGQDGAVYLGNFPGNMVALGESSSGDTFKLLWRFHPLGASSFHTTPTLGQDGAVYVGFSTGGATPEAKGTFYALRPPASGIEAQVAWSADLGPGRQTSSPTLGADGTIYAVSGAGKLFAFAADGAVKWTAQTGPSLKAAPALADDGTVYLSSMDGKLYAVMPAKVGAQAGAVRWAFDFGQHQGSLPLVTASVPPPGANAVGSGASPTIGPDGTIYVGANNSNFYAIAPDGTLKWMFEAEREVAGIWSTAALSADASTLYFGANKGGIYALNTKDGTLRWQFKVYGSVYNSPTLDSRGTLYTGATIGHVYALDSASGELIFDYDAGAPVWTAPTIRPDGSLVISDTRGKVMLLGER